MIEVEIRVYVTDEQARALIAGAQFESQKSLVTEIYDTADFKLTTKNFWLRRRNGAFELKYPAMQGANLQLDQNIPVYEITDELEIRRILQLQTKGTLQEALSEAGVVVLYRFTNTRQTYTKDGFTIDFDHADFGDLTYNICEIEKLVALVDQTKQALDSLYAFAKRYGISTERAEGKLEHYMRIKNPAHYYAIANSLKNKA